MISGVLAEMNRFEVQDKRIERIALFLAAQKKKSEEDVKDIRLIDRNGSRRVESAVPSKKLDD